MSKNSVNCNNSKELLQLYYGYKLSELYNSKELLQLYYVYKLSEQ